MCNHVVQLLSTSIVVDKIDYLCFSKCLDSRFYIEAQEFVHPGMHGSVGDLGARLVLYSNATRTHTT